MSESYEEYKARREAQEEAERNKPESYADRYEREKREAMRKPEPEPYVREPEKRDDEDMVVMSWRT